MVWIRSIGANLQRSRKSTERLTSLDINENKIIPIFLNHNRKPPNLTPYTLLLYYMVNVKECKQPWTKQEEEFSFHGQSCGAIL
jgi:hypothetical protein